jgi:hypothetical protein
VDLRPATLCCATLGLAMLLAEMGIPVFCWDCGIQPATLLSSLLIHPEHLHQAQHISGSRLERQNVANHDVQDLTSRRQQQQEVELDWAGPGSSAPAEAPNVCCRAVLSCSRVDHRAHSRRAAAHQPTTLQSPPDVLQPSPTTSRQAARLIPQCSRSSKPLRPWAHGTVSSKRLHRQDVAGAQVHREAAGLPATVGGEAGDKLHFHWLKGLFEDACAALSGGLDALCAFIGIKVKVAAL